MTPVHIATKPYIKAWLDLNLANGIVDRHHFVGACLINLLKRDTDVHGCKNVSYKETTTVYIRSEERRKQGAWLNVTETMQFNNMMGEIIRKEVRSYILSYLEFDPRLTRAIAYARKKTGLDIEVLSDDAIIKDFQRYRAKHGGLYLYKKSDLPAAA